MRVVDFQTFQHLGGYSGSSDHCPVWCKIVRNSQEYIQYLDEQKDFVKGLDVFTIEQDDAIDLETTVLWKHPFIEMRFRDVPTQCFLDTGCAFTI